MYFSALLVIILMLFAYSVLMLDSFIATIESWLDTKAI